MKIADNVFSGIKEGWQTHDFASADLAAYAHKITTEDARHGLMMSGFVLFCLAIMDAVMFARFGFAGETSYTFALLGALALHIMISARSVTDARSAYLLGTTLLIITGSAFVLLANSLGAFDVGLLASITLLFMVVPVVPWGLREASMVLGLIYLMFTGAVYSTHLAMDMETWWSLQFIMLGAGIISLVMVWRNTMVRKADIKVRFRLEQARREMMHLSNKDPLTGVWNRRYLTDQFSRQTSYWREQGLQYHFAFIDIDDFKAVNDSYGHDAGDWVLKVIADAFAPLFHNKGTVVRMGGDEFAILFASNNPEQDVAEGVRNLQSRVKRSRPGRVQQVGLSIGMVSMSAYDDYEQRDIYRQADAALYEAKRRKQLFHDELNMVCHEMQVQA